MWWNVIFGQGFWAPFSFVLLLYFTTQLSRLSAGQFEFRFLNSFKTIGNVLSLRNYQNYLEFSNTYIRNIRLKFDSGLWNTLCSFFSGKQNSGHPNCRMLFCHYYHDDNCTLSLKDWWWNKYKSVLPALLNHLAQTEKKVWKIWNQRISVLNRKKVITQPRNSLVTWPIWKIKTEGLQPLYQWRPLVQLLFLKQQPCHINF